MYALELKALEKHYPGFTLGPLDLALPGGTICGLIGENGAGKSTTIRLILDIIRRDGGSVHVLGQEAAARPQQLKAEVGAVLEGGGLPACMDAAQIGRLMAGIYPNWDAAAYADYCRRFALPARKPFGKLSRGMRMKQCIAVALSHHPKLLLLDEATSGLDPVARDELLDILLDFARDEQHSILISSHIVSDLEKLCDTVAFLHRGRLLLCEDKDTLREGYGLWHGSAADFAALPAGAALGRRATPYGVEALVRREQLPPGAPLAPVGIEELFVMMVKGETAA